jgi:hypothetical protein
MDCPADLRQALDDSRILHPSPGGYPADPHGLCGGFHARIREQRHDESLAQFRPFIAVTPRFRFI